MTQTLQYLPKSVGPQSLTSLGPIVKNQTLNPFTLKPTEAQIPSNHKLTKCPEPNTLSKPLN